MSEGPTWIVADPAKPYPDRRFDGVTPPLDPQQPTPEQIADAAWLAAADMETVFRLYGHIQTHPLPKLRALLDMLTPFAPKWETMIEDMDAARQFVAEWQATEGEDEKDQGDEDAHRPIGLFNYRSYRQ